jgi:Reverse transcriptase (RNA-dependent DNA polymerase).
MLESFMNVTEPRDFSGIPKDKVQCRIQIQPLPQVDKIQAKTWRLFGRKHDIAKTAVLDRVNTGILTPSSPYSSPLLVVPKPDGTVRACGDYRKLNDATMKDAYPLPHIEDFLAKLSCLTIFSKLDLVEAFYQIPMASFSITLTDITMPLGLFEFM